MVERQGGHIINISSLAGQEVYPQGEMSIIATKHAVAALSKVYAGPGGSRHPVYDPE